MKCIKSSVSALIGEAGWMWDVRAERRSMCDPLWSWARERAYLSWHPHIKNSQLLLTRLITGTSSAGFIHHGCCVQRGRVSTSSTFLLFHSRWTCRSHECVCGWWWCLHSKNSLSYSYFHLLSNAWDCILHKTRIKLFASEVKKKKTFGLGLRLSFWMSLILF